MEIESFLRSAKNVVCRMFFSPITDNPTSQKRDVGQPAERLANLPDYRVGCVSRISGLCPLHAAQANETSHLQFGVGTR